MIYLLLAKTHKKLPIIKFYDGFQAMTTNDNSDGPISGRSQSDLPLGNVFTLICCVYILLCL